MAAAATAKDPPKSIRAVPLAMAPVDAIPLKVAIMEGAPANASVTVVGAVIAKVKFAPVTVNLPKSPATEVDSNALVADLTPPEVTTTVPAAVPGANVPKVSGLVAVIAIGVNTVALATPLTDAAMATEDSELKATTTVARRAKRFDDFMLTPSCRNVLV